MLGEGTAAGIYDLRRLKIKRCGELATRALLALDFCHFHPTFCPPSKNQEQIILLFVQVTKKSQRARVRLQSIVLFSRKWVGKANAKGESGIDGGSIGLPAPAIFALSMHGAPYGEVSIENSCRFMLYLNEANDYIRTSFRLGLLSILLAIIGMIVSVSF